MQGGREGKYQIVYFTMEGRGGKKEKEDHFVVLKERGSVTAGT